MDYKLFDDYITLQSLLKTTGILHSGGAIKPFLENNLVLFNGEKETRRGKKLRAGDKIELPQQNIQLHIITPSQEEIDEYLKDKAEKERVAALVKEMNKKNKQEQALIKKIGSNKQKEVSRPIKRPVRFPGT